MSIYLCISLSISYPSLCLPTNLPTYLQVYLSTASIYLSFLLSIHPSTHRLIYTDPSKPGYLVRQPLELPVLGFMSAKHSTWLARCRWNRGHLKDYSTLNSELLVHIPHRECSGICAEKSFWSISHIGNVVEYATLIQLDDLFGP